MNLYFMPNQIPLEFDEKAKQTLQGDAKKVLEALSMRLNDLKSFTSSEIENISKAISQELTGGKLGQVAMPLRAALTGTTVSPSIFHAAEILGKEETLARLQASLK
jgi:glutamyl-tRNA synthetase